MRRAFVAAVLVVGAAIASGCDQSSESTADREPVAESEAGCNRAAAARPLLRATADTIVATMSAEPGIFVGGYGMRTLVAASDVFDEPRYLETAVNWADSLVARQGARGYWPTGYSNNIYLADTASALGLLFMLHPRVDEARRVRYEDAITRHVAAIEKDGLIRPSGAIGVGWQADGDKLTLFPDDYTIASALCGGMVYSWMFHHTGDTRYRDISWNAISWIFRKLRVDGVFPYVLAGHGADFSRQDDPEHFEELWDKWRYDTSTYVSEGLIAFATHCATPETMTYVRQAATVHAEFLLTSQNPDGSWAPPGGKDQKRSPGVVNFLRWYDGDIQADPRVDDAICRYLDFLTDPANAAEYGFIALGADDVFDNRIITALTGRSLADLVTPGVDVRWDD